MQQHDELQARSFTWKHFKWMVFLQDDNQGSGSDAEDLPWSKIHTIINLEIEPPRHRAYKQSEIDEDQTSVLFLIKLNTFTSGRQISS